MIASDSTLLCHIRDRAADRFYARVDRSAGPDRCWPWLGARNAGGYGRLRSGAGTVYAHRVAYFLSKGAITAGYDVCHACDNPPCCNPAHLWAGTHRENSLDAAAKGRFRPRRGERSPFAKLTTAQVRAIRIRAAAGESQRALGRAYGVSQVAIHLVVHRINWAHVADKPVLVTQDVA